MGKSCFVFDTISIGTQGKVYSGLGMMPALSPAANQETRDLGG